MDEGSKMAKKQRLIFDKRQTNIAKGVALLMLLWHHLFYNSSENYSLYTSVFPFRITGVPIESLIADFCKVCVAIFLLLSGYGLYRSYSSYYEQNAVNGKLPKNKIVVYIKNHLISLLSSYWFIFIVFVPLGLFFGRSFLTYYGLNPLYYLADFLGLSFLFFEYDATMNVTWWFMSIIIVYYVIFPFLFRIQKYNSILLLVLSAFILFCPFIPDFRQLKTWQFAFIFGMYISENNIFEKIKNKQNNFCTGILCSLGLVLISVMLRYIYLGNSVQFDAIFAFSIILFSFFVFSKIPFISKIIYELGKYSGQIFMFHTFIYGYYFKGFIYWFKYSIIIYIVMIVICYLIARLLTWLMKITGYNKLINKFILNRL